MKYPRVLIVSLERINSADTANNGLLLRNLFAGWPRDNLAQIYSSGDNCDTGFLGHYYQLGPQDRRLGHIFYKMKTEAFGKTTTQIPSTSTNDSKSNKRTTVKSLIKRLLVDTGLYELIFRPQLSKKMLSWVNAFNPDIIFAQGYNLTFALLPIMLKAATDAQMAFLTTDDWPTYLYSGQLGEPKIFKWLLRPAVRNATRKIMLNVDVPFAFGQPMVDEYSKRYGKSFIILSHADRPKRFDEATPHHCHPDDIFTILAMGSFNKFRWPLLLDINECCKILRVQGVNARVAVLSAGIEPAGMRKLKRTEYIDIYDDPGNDRLPAFLKGADLLLLAEGFDEGFVSAIQLSVSSKSHLFMFSKRPILVYGHIDTGVIKYAEEFQWAYTVTCRNIHTLLSTINNIINNKNKTAQVVRNATKTTNKFHLLELNQSTFLTAMSGCLKAQE